MPHMHAVSLGNQKGTSDTLELELQEFLECHVGDEN